MIYGDLELLFAWQAELVGELGSAIWKRSGAKCVFKDFRERNGVSISIFSLKYSKE